jgi:hypothetical protein
MFTKRLSKVFLFGISLFALLVLVGHNPGLLASVATVTPTPGGLFTSPLPTPMSLTPQPPAPVPTPAPSQAALAARDHLAQSQGIPVESLVIVNEQRTQYPNLGRTFQAVKLLDIRPNGRFYALLVDLNDGKVIEDVDSIEAAEEHARVEKYSKLQTGTLRPASDDEGR